jgi:putative glycosyltransferase (TIGR04348 family)
MVVSATKRCTVALIDPAAQGRSGGNRVTALRWAGILRGLGLRVQRAATYTGQAADLMVALHAVRSADSIARFAAEHPELPLIVAATGTDLNTKATRAIADSVLALADAIVVLQDLALPQLPAPLRARAHVIVQSVLMPPEPPPAPSGFQVCVIANLRAVKDPLLIARAVELLPASVQARAVLLGDALDPDLATQARAHMQRSLRFAWLGAFPRRRALRLLQGSHVLVSSSHSEGGANAVGEAIVAGVPPLVTAIPGSLGLLGEDWPATFAVGDARGLADLLLRAAHDAAFLGDLRARLVPLAPRFARPREIASWQQLLARVVPEYLPASG